MQFSKTTTPSTQSRMLLLIALMGCSACHESAPSQTRPPSENIAPHPRLLMVSERIAEYRTHPLTSDFILPKARLLAADTPTAFDFPSPIAELAFQQAGNNLFTLAFAARMAEDEPALLQAALAAIEAVCSWETWGGKEGNVENRDHALQYMLRGAAFAYDWLYPFIGDELRQRFRVKLAQQAERMYQAATLEFQQELGWGNWWVASYQQNHWSTNNAALGLAALAIYDEDPQAERWLRHAVAQLRIKKALLEGIEDGTWHEGLQYQSADLLHMIPFWVAAQHCLEEELAPGGAYLGNFVLWRTYNYLPKNVQGLLAFADYEPSARGGLGWHLNIVLQYLAGSREDGRALWLKQAVEQAAVDQLGWFRSQDEAAYLIYEVFYTPAVQPAVHAPQDLALDGLFPDQGTVIWRSGWDEDATVFGLRFGAYLGEYLQDYSLANELDLAPDHEHRDAGAFSLYLAGVDLSTELAGKAAYQATDLHNTLLIQDSDGFDAQGQFRSEYDALTGGAAPRLLSTYSTPGLSFALGDLTDRYREERGGREPPGEHLAARILRGFAFVKEDDSAAQHYLLSFDELTPREHAPARQTAWQMFLPLQMQGTLMENGAWLTAAADDHTSLSLLPLLPRMAEREISSRVLYSNEKAYIALKSTLHEEKMLYLTALVPRRNGAVLPHLEVVAQDAQAVLIQEGSPFKRLIAVNPGGALVTLDELTTDGRFVLLEPRSDGMLKVIYCDAAHIEFRGQRLLAQSERDSGTLIEAMQ